jgi:2'-5' RNA ligase
MTFDLEATYKHIHQKGLDRLAEQKPLADPFLLTPEKDNRYGLTLIIKPPRSVKGAIKEKTADLAKAFPYQYFYPDNTLHITALTIISCYSGFSLKTIDINEYVALINNSLKEIRPFDIQMKGLILSPTGIIVKGYPLDDSLEKVRANLRKKFSGSNLEQSLDKRYSIQTAHCSLMRYKSTITSRQALQERVEQFEDYTFGTFKTHTLELVYNDWYHQEEKVKYLHSFQL